MSDAQAIDTVDDSAPTAPSSAPSGTDNGPLEYVYCNIDPNLLNNDARNLCEMFNLFFDSFVENDDNFGTFYMGANHQDSFDYILSCAILSVKRLATVFSHLGNPHPDQDVPAWWELRILFVCVMRILNHILLGIDAEGNHLPLSVQHLASMARTLDAVMSQISNVPRTTAELVSMAIAEPILVTCRAQEQQNRSIMDSINQVRNILVACPQPTRSTMRQPTPGPSGPVSFAGPPHSPSPFVVSFGEESNSPHTPAIFKKGKRKAADWSQSQAPTPDPRPAQKTFAQVVSTPVAPTTSSSWSASRPSVISAMQMAQQMQLPAVLTQSLISSLLAGNTAPTAPAPGWGQKRNQAVCSAASQACALPAKSTKTLVILHLGPRDNVRRTALTSDFQELFPLKFAAKHVVSINHLLDTM